MKQTAVEWLEEQIGYISIEELKTQILLAKEMEKQQIIEAYYEGDNNGAVRVYNRSMKDDISAEEYFNETFNK